MQYDASYLRQMADRCRRLAQQVTDEDTKTELANMAEDFEGKVAEVEREEAITRTKPSPRRSRS
jgi:hypothetical protein